MSNIPGTLRYTAEHEWISIDDSDVVTVGITDYAQDALGDITFLELPEVGDELEAQGTFGVVESVKTFSDLYAPVAGTVVEVNSALLDTPDEINTDPYGSWIVKMRVADKATVGALMNAAAYEKHLEDAG